jgi:transglutaminase-like putative cysteine protease
MLSLEVQETTPSTAPDPARPELLRPTPALDFEHASVRAFVGRVTEGAGSPMESASRLFAAVRDEVKYDPYVADMQPHALSASATLERGRAFCVPKAVLYAACLRAVGVPCRLGFSDVTNHLSTQKLIDVLRTRVFAFHGYAVLWNGRAWLKASPAFDAGLCRWFGVAPLTFDGEEDAVLQAYDGSGRAFMEYLTDRGTYDDLPVDEMERVWREVYPHLFGLAP